MYGKKIKKTLKNVPSLAFSTQELVTIRSVLPYGWRKMAVKRSPETTERQLTEVLGQRTSNPRAWVVFLDFLVKILVHAGDEELLAKARKMKSFYKQL